MSARAWAAFATVSTLWGIPYLFIKIAVDDGVPPAFLAFVRVALGAAVLMALAWRAGTLGALRGRGRWLALYALFEIVVPFPLIAAGERHVASSLAAIIIAAVPLFVALLALRFDHAERATGSRLVGLDRGPGRRRGPGRHRRRRARRRAAGRRRPSWSPPSATPPGRWSSSARSPTSTRAPRWGRAWSIAAVALAPLAAVDPPSAVPSAQALVALVVLGIFCTAAAFVFFGVLIAEVGPGRGLVITYVAPVVAVTLGVTVLGERPGAGAVAGLLLILAGSWLSTDGRLPPPPGGHRHPAARAPRGTAPWNGVRTR